MKPITFLFLLLFSSPLFAQEWNIGTRWLYFQDDYMPDMIDEYILFEVSSDTLIENDTFLVLDEYYLREEGAHLKYFKQFTHFVRKVGDKVLVKGQLSNQSYPLYDFGAAAGDTILVKVAGQFVQNDDEFIQVRIDSVGIVSYNGSNWPTQFVTTIFNNAGYSFQQNILTGIGEMAYLFPIPGFVDPPPGGYLACFDNGVEGFPEVNQCDIILPVVEIKKTDTYVFPNPVISTLHVQAENITHWELFNVGGVRKGEGGELAEIDVSGYTAGNYFLILYNRNAIAHISKIIINRR